MQNEWAENLRHAVANAATRQDAREAVAEVYRDLQQQIDQRRPVCSMSGRCCRFEEFGHRLYVTTLELAAFLHGLSAGGPRVPPSALEEVPGNDWDGTGCPYQVQKMCTVHLIRPFGCRVFFCDETAGQWQQEQYERFHQRLRQLHEGLQVPYFYVEWRQALRYVVFPLLALPPML